jgi:hypothetical protein
MSLYLVIVNKDSLRKLEMEDHREGARDAYEYLLPALRAEEAAKRETIQLKRASRGRYYEPITALAVLAKTMGPVEARDYYLFVRKKLAEAGLKNPTPRALRRLLGLHSRFRLPPDWKAFPGKAKLPNK